MTDQLPPEVTVISASEALSHAREAALFTRQAVAKLEAVSELQQTPPEFRTIVINPDNNGQYVTMDQSRFEAKSIGVINPTAYAVYLGVGGVSATVGARAIAVAPQSFLVLPLAIRNLELGCDPTVLLTVTAVVYVLRFLTVQPLNVQKLG